MTPDAPGPAVLALLIVLGPGLVILARADPSPRLLLWEVLLVALAWVGLGVRGIGWGDVGLRAPEGWGTVAALGTLGGAALLGGSLLLRLGLERFPGWRTDRSAFGALEGDPRALAAALAAAWVVGAFGEELLYRGFLLHTLHALLPAALATGAPGWWIALGATSVLFGLAHGFQGRAAVVVAGAIGVGYGALYLAAGFNLWPAILAHGLYDTVAFVLVYRGIRVGDGRREG